MPTVRLSGVLLCIIVFSFHAFDDSAGFNPRDAMLARYSPSSCVCPSICLSVTSRFSTKTTKPRITRTMPYDTQGTLVF